MICGAQMEIDGKLYEFSLEESARIMAMSEEEQDANFARLKESIDCN